MLPTNRLTKPIYWTVALASWATISIHLQHLCTLMWVLVCWALAHEPLKRSTNLMHLILNYVVQLVKYNDPTISYHCFPVRLCSLIISLCNLNAEVRGLVLNSSANEEHQILRIEIRVTEAKFHQTLALNPDSANRPEERGRTWPQVCPKWYEIVEWTWTCLTIESTWCTVCPIHCTIATSLKYSNDKLLKQRHTEAL